MSETKEVNPIITEMEQKYPEMTKEFKRILKYQYELFCKKQKSYGTSNVSVGTNLETPQEVKLSLTGLWFRKNDKINRLKQMVLLNVEDNLGESIEDAYQDLSIYGVISQIVKNGKWGK